MKAKLWINFEWTETELTPDVLKEHKIAIGHNSTIRTGGAIGDNVTIGNHVYIGANVIIGDNVTIRTGGTIGDNVTIGANSTIGDNVTIGNHVYIGANVTIGDNVAIVTGGNIWDNAIVYGEWDICPISVCGLRHPVTVERPDIIHVGCQGHPYDWWMDEGNWEVLAVEEFYTDRDIEDTRNAVEYCYRWLSNHQKGEM